MPMELRRGEVHLAQVACAVSQALVVEVLRPGVAALATRRHRKGPHAVAELDDSDEAVAARPVVPLGPLVTARPEGGERAPPRRCEAHRDARPSVGEGLHDVTGEALEAIDLPPRRAPSAEVARQSL